MNILFNEIKNGFKEIRIWSRLAKMAIDTQYKQNTLGPFWISVNTAILVVAFSIVYGEILSVNLADHMIYVASGLICWYLYSSAILKGCMAFIVSRQLILQLPLPLSVHVFRLIYQELLIFFYNLPVLIFVCLLFKRDIGYEIFAILPAFVLIVVNIYFSVFLLAIIATRYRDVTSTVQALVTPMMFLTPIIWSVDSLDARPAFVSFNPLYHMIEIWRSPITGSPFPYESWLFTIALTLIVIVMTGLFYKKYCNRVAFWL